MGPFEIRRGRKGRRAAPSRGVVVSEEQHPGAELAERDEVGCIEDEDVSAGPAAKHVVALAAVDCIVAGHAREVVAELVALDRVGEARPADGLDLAQASKRSSAEASIAQADLDPARQAEIVGGIDAGAAAQGVPARAAVERSLPFPPERTSFPPPPKSLSLPSPPKSSLRASSPRKVSPNRLPIRFSTPVKVSSTPPPLLLRAGRQVRADARSRQLLPARGVEIGAAIEVVAARCR